ncbi:MAG TPA: DUF6351 family protein [Myxococcales bacterium]|nr:DUF6351 family protein [Myxococcales bacterium]
MKRLLIGFGSFAVVLSVQLLLSRAAAAHDRGDGFTIRTLSTWPDRVTGGDVLVEIAVPAGQSQRSLIVSLNGRNVTGAFRAGRSPSTLLGLVTELSLGRNTLTVESKGRHGPPSESVALINHAIIGPIFSGPHQAPFICETQTFVLPVTGGNLGPPLDADCSTTTRVDYVYRSTGGTLKPLPNPAVHPADLAQTTTSQGNRVSYIVRVETGTINRAIYQISILHDPAAGPVPDPWTSSPSWNGRLLYSYGGGAKAGYHQGRTTGGVLSAASGGDVLALGYAMAASSLNVFGNNADDVLSAETTMMVREHFIERYGVPVYTLGTGSSGGSMQLHSINQNYPGMMQGFAARNSFPELLTFGVPLGDCALLERAFDTSSLTWTLDQKTAVGGWGTWQHCINNRTWNAGYKPNGAVTDNAGCDPGIPPALIYDPVRNPGGARCTWHDNLVNVFGRDPRTGFARRSLDNVGVQYGLNAFNAGLIDAEQFLDLNARVGGYDIDGNIVAAREVADRKALRIAYRTGRIDSGAGGLPDLPIIHFRPWRDDIGDVHDAVRSLSFRQRLINTNGTAANHVNMVCSNVGTGAGRLDLIEVMAIRLVDQWVENVVNDPRPGSAPQKVARNKPAGLVDACFTVTGERITDPATCARMYPAHGNPRLAAGEPLAQDVLKCKLKKVDARSYARALTASQLARLKSAFPEGVCDYSRAGVGQKPLADTWLSYPLPGRFEEDRFDDD